MSEEQEKKTTPHDSLAKEMLCTVLRDYGEARPHFEIVASASQYADVWFSPQKSDAASVPPIMRLLVRMCEKPSILEAYSETPRPSRVMDCVTKSLTWMRKQGDKRPPRLWILSPGVPVESLKDWRARSNGRKWVTGFYSFPEPMNTHVVVLSELPPGPETLILRLLGRSPVRDFALVEARARLPQLVKHPIGAVLARWHRIAVESSNPTPYEKELIMDPEAIRLADEYFENGRREARIQGLQHDVLRVFEVRHGEAPEALRQVVELCSDLTQLDVWLSLVATQSREAVLAQMLA